MTLSRRTFVTGTAAVLGASALARAGEPPQDSPTVLLDCLTSREVGEWMKKNDAIFVPHGPISGHGPWTTLGAHPHAAEAVSVLLARKCGGLVYPALHTCFAGATRTYPGTVPFSYEFHIQVLKTVARALYSHGFGRIFFVCHTNPEDSAGLIAARDLFDFDGEMPVASLVASKGMASDPVRKLLEGQTGSAGEAILDYAALRILGRERAVAEPELARTGLKSGQDQNPEIREAVNTLRARGTRGFRYDTEREHASHGTVGSDLTLGLKLLDALADFLLPAVEALARHRDYLKSHPARRLEKQVPLPP